MLQTSQNERKIARLSLSQERLKKRYIYNVDTGVFTRSTSGKPAGTIDLDGYLRISVHCFLYRAHRLAFLYMNGSWPKEQIDHIDGNRLNNAWANLREATNAENAQNVPRDKQNKSGFVGAFFNKQSRRWTSSIKVSGKNILLGSFTSAEEAAAAYKAAKARLHKFSPTIRPDPIYSAPTPASSPASPSSSGSRSRRR